MVIRTGLFAPPVDEPVHAPADTSFTGRATAAIQQYGLVSNAMDYTEVSSARHQGVALEVSDEELLKRVPAEFQNSILEERDSYGSHAALVYRNQLMQDLENNRTLDSAGMVAGMGYSVLALVADPTSLVPMGAAAKAGFAGSRIAAGVIAKQFGEAAGKTALKIGNWSGVAAAESIAYNSPRLAGDHTYFKEQFATDVMLETAMGTALGVVINGSTALRAYQRAKNDAVMRDVEKAADMKRRRDEGDWSSFELSERAKAVEAEVGRKAQFASDTDKWAHEFLMEETSQMLQAVKRVQKIPGDVGDALRSELDVDVSRVLERIKLHNKSPEDAISILDDVTAVNKQLSVLSGDFKSIQTLEGSVAVDTIRSIMREAMDTRLESLVGDRLSKRLNVSQMNKIAATEQGKAVKSTFDVLRPLLSKEEWAQEIAMKVARGALYYKGNLPVTKARLLEQVNTLVAAGKPQQANKLLDVVLEDMPHFVEVPEISPQRVASMRESIAADAVQTGDVSVPRIEKVLEELQATGEHEALLSEALGKQAVFGKIDFDDVFIPKQVAAVVGSKLWKDSTKKVAKAVKRFMEYEAPMTRTAAKPQDFVASAGALLGRTGGLTKDLSTSLRESGSATLEYIGTRLTELGKGYGGATKRKHTAAVIKEAELTKSLSQVLPQYHNHINTWLQSQGHNAVARYNAANKAGAQNKLADEFNKTFMKAINRLHLGKGSADLHPSIQSLVNDWNTYMDYNFGRMVDNGIEGFSKDAKLNNYAPQIWLQHRLKKLVDDGDPRLRPLLEKGYRGADNSNPETAADALLKWLEESAGNDVDQFMPRQDSRSFNRTAIDWSAEVDGLKLTDLLDMEVPAIATKYSNRMAGWVGVVKSTDGAIRNGTDVSVLREMVRVESGDNAKAVRMFDDTMNLMFGRPTRGGLPEWIRNAKELATLSRMGGLGAAQLAETGVVATRTIMQAMQDPRMFKKVLQFSKKGEEYTDLVELTKLSGYDKDYALLTRQSVNLETMDAPIDSMATAFNRASDLVTFGSAKAAGSRALGQVTGYDAVRKYQSYVAQRSYGISVAKHFKDGTGKISNARLADWGLTDINGSNQLLKDNINKHVVFDADGYPSAYNFDKWDVKAREDFWYSMQRMESQTQARALAGELPEWMNSPAMGVLMQFRQMSLTTSNKTLARQAAFADQEAVAEITLAVMAASVVRAAKVYGLAATGAALTGEDLESALNQRAMMSGQDRGLAYGADMYVNHFGVYADVYNTAAVLGREIGDLYSNTVDSGEFNVDKMRNAMASQIPALGVMNSAFKAGKALNEEELDAAARESRGLMILGNTYLMDVLAKAISGQLED